MYIHWASHAPGSLLAQEATEMNKHQQCPGAAGGLGQKPDLETLGQVAKLRTILEAHVNAMEAEGRPRCHEDVEESKTKEAVDTQLGVCRAHPSSSGNCPALVRGDVSLPYSSLAVLVGLPSRVLCSPHTGFRRGHMIQARSTELLPDFFQAGTRRRGLRPLATKHIM